MVEVSVIHWCVLVGDAFWPTMRFSWAVWNSSRALQPGGLAASELVIGRSGQIDVC